MSRLADISTNTLSLTFADQEKSGSIANEILTFGYNQSNICSYSLHTIKYWIEMNVKSIQPTLKAWFDEYTRRFSSDDPVVQEAMDLKVEHTRRVCEGIVNIGLNLDLSDEDLCIAEISALMHDIGRFEQYRRHRTFLDHKSEDHALLGVKIIQSNGILKGLERTISELIIFLVKSHNLAALPLGETERSLFFLKMLRDADKIDIWRVVTEYYQNPGHNRRCIEMDLPNSPQVSKPVYEALINGKIAKMPDLKTLTDFKLLQMGWVYDLNFPVTFQMVLENGYLEKIRDALPQNSVRVNKIYERAQAHVENKALAEGQRHQHIGKFTEGLLDHKRILKTLKIRAGQTLLDAGCGNGYMSKLFSNAVTPSGKVYAMDPDKYFINILKNETQGTNIETIEGDVTEPTQLNESLVDIIYISTVIHGFSKNQMRGFLQEAKRLLKPDAILAVVEIEKKETPFGPPMESRYSPEELQQIVPMAPVETIQVGRYFYMQIFQNKEYQADQ